MEGQQCVICSLNQIYMVHFPFKIFADYKITEWICPECMRRDDEMEKRTVQMRRKYLCLVELQRKFLYSGE